LKPKRILITGPPLNGRDDYIRQVLDLLEKVNYHHLFTEMQKVAETYGLHLTRANVLTVPQHKLQQIRSDAINEIVLQLQKSENDFEIISTPASFRVEQSSVAPDGKIDGFTVNDLNTIDPDMVIVFIADLFEVKQNLLNDPDWKDRVSPDLKTLAEWRRMAINSILDYSKIYFASKNKSLDMVIFAKGHEPRTLADLIIGEKPRIYLSYHITDTAEESMIKLNSIKDKLSKYFVCIDPLSIKDWALINKYDDALQSEVNEIEMSGVKLPVSEVAEAIDEIRTQTVLRDYELIAHTYATVVCHIEDKPSYGVMSEIIYTNTEAINPVYVLYPHRKRPSPFFEYYAGPNNIFYYDDIGRLTESLIAKMCKDIKDGKWTKIAV
jgi:adenylate kinase